MRVVLVHPPIVQELRKHGGVKEDKSRDDGEGPPGIPGDESTHTNFLGVFARKGNSLTKTKQVTY